MRKLSAIVATIAVFVPSTGAAVATPVAHRFGVVGVHIGEKRADAFSALRGQGYRIVEVSRSDSFNQRLLDARNAELRQPIGKVRATDIGSVIATQADQRIRINFDDDATGARVVALVYYEASSVAHPFNRVRRTIVSRYGPPLTEDGTGAVWCANDSAQVCLAEGTRGERLKVGHDHRGFDPNALLTTIQLNAGTGQVNSWRAAFRAALSRLVKSRDAF